MNFTKMQHRYENDINFHTMVNALEAAIEQLQLTPSELREAAMYAAIRHEQRQSRPIFRSEYLLKPKID